MKPRIIKPEFNQSIRLLISIFLNTGITMAELVGGILSNSLALLSDAIHNLSDTLGLLLAWFASMVSGRKPDVRRTFGYKRFEILSAFINASVLTGISLYLVYEAIHRFLQPEPVKSSLMLIIAVAGLAANFAAVLFLHPVSKKSLNVKAAYLHLLGDTLSSVAVIGGALVMFFSKVYWIDPVLSIIISVVIIIQAYKILHATVDILMQSTPGFLDLKEIKKLIEEHPMVANLHHIHCWQMHDKDVLFEAHVEINHDISLSEVSKIQAELEKTLAVKFGIHHTTLQMEYGYCEDTEMIKQSKHLKG